MQTTSEFFREAGEPITFDITDKVLAPLPLGSRTLRVPFAPPTSYFPGRQDYPQFRAVEVEYERYSLSQNLTDLVKEEAWGDNRLRFFEDQLVTITFVAPNNMRIRG